MSTKKTKWTPGPWFAFHGGNEMAISRDADGMENIARVHINVNGEAGGESLPEDANARLIAAAPDLAAAALRMGQTHGWGCTDVACGKPKCDAGRMAMAALRKAGVLL